MCILVSARVRVLCAFARICARPVCLSVFQQVAASVNKSTKSVSEKEQQVVSGGVCEDRIDEWRCACACGPHDHHYAICSPAFECLSLDLRCTRFSRKGREGRGEARSSRPSQSVVRSFAHSLIRQPAHNTQHSTPLHGPTWLRANPRARCARSTRSRTAASTPRSTRYNMHGCGCRYFALVCLHQCCGCHE